MEITLLISLGIYIYEACYHTYMQTSVYVSISIRYCILAATEYGRNNEG